MRIIIRNGLVTDPLLREAQVRDLVLEDGRVSTGAGDHSGVARASETVVIDATGRVVLPGLIDAHTHLREPGQEHKEDITSGTAAAAAGGFTTVAAMPNTDPVIDSRAGVKLVLRRAAEVGKVNVLVVGAVTKGQKGEELAELGEMAEAGAVAFSDDGRPVSGSELLRCALEYARMFDRPVISHCEDEDLFNDGVMHQGYWSTVLGLRGIPAAAEEVHVARDAILAGMTGGRVHLTHLSTAGSMEILRWAKSRGFPVTADVTPHHLALTDQAVRTLDYDPDTKVNPPLRSEEDVLALRQAVRDGLVDLIATDHAPHHPDDKDVEYNYAAFGVAGLETALAVAATFLVEPGYLDWPGLAVRMSLAPARLLGLHAERGHLSPGAMADVTIVDPAAEWTVDPSKFAGKGRNTPFKGMRLRGRVTDVVVSGRLVVREGRLV